MHIRQPIVAIVLLFLSGCAAQHSTPAVDPYTPIATGLSGPGFRAAVDNKLNGTQEIDPQLGFTTTRPQGAVSTLPGSPFKGERYDVTDCTVCTFGSTCIGGGSGLCLEVYNGTAWIAY